MPRKPTVWRSHQANRAVATLADVRRSIERLPAEDLLDLHDIFRDRPDDALNVLAEAEMERRGLTA